VSGGSLYRKTSFLVDALGTTVFSPVVTLVERPHLPRGQASSWYDDEGVATRDRDVVRDGVLRGYFLGSYSARKLGMKTTGSAGGNHNLVLQGGDLDLEALIRKMGRGLLVTELIGFGVNLVTGDYSRGAAGFWVEGGEIRYPVEEITIAGNLRDMFRSISAIGSDALTRGSPQLRFDSHRGDDHRRKLKRPLRPWAIIGRVSQLEEGTNETTRFHQDCRTGCSGRHGLAGGAGWGANGGAADGELAPRGELAQEP